MRRALGLILSSTLTACAWMAPAATRQPVPVVQQAAPVATGPQFCTVGFLVTPGQRVGSVALRNPKDGVVHVLAVYAGDSLCLRARPTPAPFYMQQQADSSPTR